MENIIPMIFCAVIILFLVAVVVLQMVVLAGIKKLKNQMASLTSLQAIKSRKVGLSQSNAPGKAQAQANKRTTAEGQVICSKCYEAVPIDEKNCPHCASLMGRR